jgi:hypothetical protein
VRSRGIGGRIEAVSDWYRQRQPADLACFFLQPLARAPIDVCVVLSAAFAGPVAGGVPRDL